MSVRLEDAIHRDVVKLLGRASKPGVIWFHCPNGENRDAITGARLKALGVRRGVADLCIVLPNGRAAFLELKAGKGRQSADQRQFQADCDAVGAPYAVAYSFDEAVQRLTEWGALRITSATAVRGAGAGGASAPPDSNTSDTEALGVPD